MLGFLAETFVESRFSLRALVSAAMLHPLFDLAGPGSCGQPSYPLPAVFNPWTPAEFEEGDRGNGVSDGISRLPPRLLRASMAAALEWSQPQTNFEVPGGSELLDGAAEAMLQSDIGIFLTYTATGFRENNFQETLAFETAFGACQDPFAEEPDAKDFVDRLVEKSTGSVEDALLDLKDRLLGEPAIEDEEERRLVEALAGVPLGTAVSDDPAAAERALRRACAAWLASPDFQLDGFPRR